MNMGFSPCGMPFLHFAHCSPFFRKLFSRAVKAPQTGGVLTPEGSFLIPERILVDSSDTA
jgi:hypothetical protein